MNSSFGGHIDPGSLRSGRCLSGSGSTGSGCNPS